jgi:hypothetical protein
MTNVLVLGIVGAFIILIIAAYIQSRETRKELIAEMKEEILSKETAPVEAPAPVVAKIKPAPSVTHVAGPLPGFDLTPVEEVKPAVATLQEVPALVEALAAKAAVQEMVATQEAPAPKPKAKRKRPAKKKPAQN